MTVIRPEAWKRKAAPVLITPQRVPRVDERPKREPGGRCGYRVRVRRETEVFLHRVLIAEGVDTWGQAAERLLAAAALEDLIGETVAIDVDAAVPKPQGGTGKGSWSFSRTVYVRIVPAVERWLQSYNAPPARVASAFLEGLRIAEGRR